MHDRLHSWIADNTASGRSLLTSLVGINTHSYNVDGLDASATLLAEMFTELGSASVTPLGTVGDVDDRGDARDIQLGPMVSVDRPGTGPAVLLIGHHDTVFSPDVDFPADFSIEPVTGPGVADAKGGIVQLWLALGSLAAIAPHVGWRLLIVPDEEIGSPGSGPLIRSAARAADLGLGFEPSFPDGGIAAARPGSGNFAIAVRGRAAHAGREHHLGRNAVVAAAEIATRIAAFTTYPDVLANPGVISGGDAVNIVPATAVVRVNIRVRTPEQAERVTEQLGALIAEVSARDGLTATLHGGFGRPPKPRTPSYERLLELVIGIAGELNIRLDAADTGGVCDGNLLADEGLVNVDNLGPVGGNLHRVGEYLHSDSIAERALLTAVLLTRAATLVQKEQPR